MINLATFEEMHKQIIISVNRVNRLEDLLKRVNEFQSLLFGEVHGGYSEKSYSYRIDTAVDELQFPLEELTAAIESELSAAKRNADDIYFELVHKVFDAE